MGEVPAREVLWNITGHWLIYPCFIAALAVAVVFFVRRWRLWKIGEPENRSDRRGERLRGAVRDALLQVKVAERRGPGLVHGAMYVAMVILLIATATVAAQADLGLPLVQGNFYLYFLSLAVDIAGAAFCIAMVACIVRRIANRALDTRPGDIVVLGLLLAIGVTGFVLEGLRIAGTGDPWGASSRDCSLAGTRGRSSLPIACCGGSIWPSPSGSSPTGPIPSSSTCCSCPPASTGAT